MLQRFKIPIIIVMTAVLTQAVGLAAQAAMPSTFLQGGKTRYAFASSSVAALTFDDTWSNVPGLSAPITIPAGQTADVIVMVCSEGETGTNSELAVRATIGGVVATPSEVGLIDNGILRYDLDPDLIWSHLGSQCAIFFRQAVPAGQTAIRIQYRATSGWADMMERSMLVIANLH